MLRRRRGRPARDRRRLLAAVASRPVDTPVGPIAITVSAGGVLGGTIQGVDRVLQAADEALYAAKRRGRDRLRLHERWTRARPSPRSRRPSEAARAALAVTASAHDGADAARGDEAATLATRVAEHLGASAATVLRSRLAALLRDIGKVAIPDAVLAKPGPLDAAESALVRRHPIVGEELVRRIDQLADVAFVIRHHHERWDGHGYPDGLAATAIPLEARIVAAVDAWLAMRSDRAYRAKRSTASALAELRRCAGTQFDPAVVDALCAVLAPASWDAVRLPVELSS